MISPFLRAKKRFYDGEPRAALDDVEAIVGPLPLPDETLHARADLPFEAFVIRLLDDAPPRFGDALGRLWAAFPGSYALNALQTRRGLDPADVEWLYPAAADGLLSTDPEDYDRIAKVVLPDALPPEADRERLELLIASASEGGAWESFVATHADLVASLFLDAVFYPARVVRSPLVLGRLERLAELQPELMSPIADALAAWPAADVASIGMRGAAPECAAQLVEALRDGDFESLSPDCLPE